MITQRMIDLMRRHLQPTPFPITMEEALQAIFRDPHTWRALIAPAVPLAVDAGGDVWMQVGVDSWLCLGPNGNGEAVTLEQVEQGSGIVGYL